MKKKQQMSGTAKIVEVEKVDWFTTLTCCAVAIMGSLIIADVMYCRQEKAKYYLWAPDNFDLVAVNGWYKATAPNGKRIYGFLDSILVDIKRACLIHNENVRANLRYLESGEKPVSAMVDWSRVEVPKQIGDHISVYDRNTK